MRGLGLFGRLPLIVFPILFALQACDSPKERAAQLASQAEAYAQQGNLVAAGTSIAAALALREDVPDYHLLQGSIALRSGDPVSAFRAFNRALEFDAVNPTALAYVANIGVQIGQINDAEDAADRLLTLQPDALPALQVKGMVALSRGKLDEAIRYGDRILAINRTDEAGAIVKARALAKKGQTEEALALIDTAMTVMKDSAVLLTNKVNIYRYLGQGEAMVQPLAQLLRTTNGSPAFRLDQVNLLYRLGRVDEARQSGLALISTGTRDAKDYRTLQRLWSEYDKTPLPDAVARNVSGWTDPLAVVTTVRWLFWRGDLTAADEVMRTAPANAQPLLASLKARLLAASGRTQEARAQVAGILAKDDRDVGALMLKARFDQEDGKDQTALEAAQLAQTNDPQNPETYVVLAQIYLARDTEFRAKQVYESGVKALPQNFYLMENYTQYLHQSGNKARAVSVARAFARALPSSVRAWDMMLAQCQWAGDAGCAQSASEGREHAKRSFLVDDTLGSFVDRGLFGRI